MAIGAAMIVLMAVLAGLLGTGNEPRDAGSAAPTSSTTTTAPPGPPLYTGVIPISDGDIRRAQLALFGGGDPQRSDDDEVVLVTLAGTELARGPLAGWYTNRPELGVDFNDYREGGVVLTTAPAIDGPLPGCDAVHGAGGVLAAVCGPESETDEIKIVAVDGSQRSLAGPVSEVGHWRFALPSPNGRWVLAQWSGECEVTQVYLVNVRSGQRRPVIAGGIPSNAIGWSPDGRAIVGLPSAACGAAGGQTGTYLVDPRTGSRRRIHAYSQGVRFTGYISYRANRLERVMSRAHDELGLADFGGQPSHGGGDAEVSFDFEGHEIYVHAIPFDELPRSVADRPGELRFDCGGDRHYLYDYGPPGSTGDPVPNRRFLERAAKRLVPGLYCTPGPTEFVDE